jgi:isoquinoline 1-oxidoreductase beta subunit
MPTTFSSVARLSRRDLLQGAGAATVLLAFRLPLHAEISASSGSQFAPNAFIRIAPDGQVFLTMPQVEMGQGVYTSIAYILAEELDADYSRVTLEHAPPDDKLYGNPAFGIQATGNSNSIRAFWKPLRTAGAAARAMLVQAAARQWQVDPDS